MLTDIQLHKHCHSSTLLMKLYKQARRTSWNQGFEGTGVTRHDPVLNDRTLRHMPKG